MTGTMDNLAGSAPPLDGGKSYTLVAFPGGGGPGASFAALLNAFRPAGGAAGFRILNATSDGRGLRRLRHQRGRLTRLAHHRPTRPPAPRRRSSTWPPARD